MSVLLQLASLSCVVLKEADFALRSLESDEKSRVATRDWNLDPICSVSEQLIFVTTTKGQGHFTFACCHRVETDLNCSSPASWEN